MFLGCKIRWFKNVFYKNLKFFKNVFVVLKIYSILDMFGDGLSYVSFVL